MKTLLPAVFLFTIALFGGNNQQNVCWPNDVKMQVLSAEKGKEIRQISSFTALKVSRAVHVTFRWGSKPVAQLTIVAKKDMLSAVKTEVKSSVLYITVDGKHRNINEPVEVEMTGLIPQTVLLDAASCLYLPDGMKAKAFEASVSAASELRWCKALDVNSLNLNIEAASRLKGDRLKASLVTMEVDAASNFSLNRMESKTVDMELSGASHLEISDLQCTEVSTEASGASSVRLAGKCEAANLEASGASSINAKMLKSRKITSNTSGGGVVRIP